MKRRGNQLKIALIALWCAAFSVLFQFPTVLTFLNSFMTQSEITRSYGAVFHLDAPGQIVSARANLKLIPDKVTFEQYATTLLKSPDYLLKFWNSVILTLPIVVFQVAIASLAAYSFMRTRGRLKGMLLFVYIFVMLMPYQVTLVPNYLTADALGLLNTRWSIILPGVFAPFSVFILTKAMRRIPAPLIEAAKLDGCGEWRIFSGICLPMCKGALFSVAILVFIDYWNMVEQVLVMLPDETKQPMSVFLMRINEGELGLAFAVATIYMIPALLLFLYGEDYLVDGITYSGGLKG
jgi:multiple sugar transport system permease protein